MMDEVNEIIRVLQLTTYDEDEWDADNLTVMKKAMVRWCCLLGLSTANAVLSSFLERHRKLVASRS